MLRELEGWMETQGYEQLVDFRGKLSQKKVDDPLGLRASTVCKTVVGSKINFALSKSKPGARWAPGFLI